MELKNASERVKYIREKLALPLRDLSGLLGISDAQLSRIEGGKRALTEDVACLFENILQVNKDWLLGKSTKEKIWATWKIDSNLQEQEDKVSYLKHYGIRTRGELLWIAGEIRKVWGNMTIKSALFHAPERGATSAWVATIVHCIDELLRLEILNLAEVKSYLSSESPSGMKLEEHPIKYLPQLYAHEKVKFTVAKSATKCFLFLLESTVYKNNNLPNEVIKRISDLLSPWIFFVLKASKHPNEYWPMVDFSLLEKVAPSGNFELTHNTCTTLVTYGEGFKCTISVADKTKIECDGFYLYALHDELKQELRTDKWDCIPKDHDTKSNHIEIGLKENNRI